MATMSNEILTAALAGLEAQRDQIAAHIASVRALLGQRSPGRPPKSEGQAGTSASDGQPKKRKFSAAARRRMAEAQRKRWAAIKG